MYSFRSDQSAHSRSPYALQQSLQARSHCGGTISTAESDPLDEQTTSVLTVVVPAHNEAESLLQLVQEITAALRPLCHGATGLDDFEIIIIDDGSTDSTALVLADLASDYPELRWLILPIQGGQTAATVAGIHAARGNWIATLDADLQNDPADLVRLWAALQKGDAVLGWRVKRQDSHSRRVISFCANWLRNAILGQSIRDTGCSVRIFPRRVGLHLPTFHGMHRFFGSLLQREGCRLVQVPVHHRARSHGRSHYTLWNRSLQVVIDLLGVAWLMQRRIHFQVTSSWGAVEKVGEAGVDVVQPARTPICFAVHSREH
jgi:dolichol-phosphate mannosyltransferase